MTEKVALIGAGLIGTGFAVNCALSGRETVLQTLEPLEQCRKNLEDTLLQLEGYGVIRPEERRAALGRCRFTASIEEAASGAGFIQESVPESLSIKRETVAKIEASAPADAVIASSASGLLMTDIFARAVHPERCLGGHPYLPVHLMPLVEVTRGERTAPETAERAVEFYRAIGKEPVVLHREVVGFLANRFQSAVHREAVELVRQGVCSVEDADKALVFGVGLRWGIMGQFLALHLGAAPEGIGHFNEKYHIDPDRPDRRLEALATWTTFPKDWCRQAWAGLEEALPRRPEAQGRDIPSISRWRDGMLIGLLLLHGRLSN